MLPRDVIKKIRQIEISTRRTVNDVLGGQYHSVFKGRGMEFSEVREYQPGDDIRTIDWNVTARMGHPFIKKFTEERELTVMLLVDVSGSEIFGSVRQLKNELAAEVAAVLAFSAIRNNDKVGLIMFSDDIELFVPPKKGKTHVLRVIREILYFQPKGRRTDIPAALKFLEQITTHRSVTFLLSDFIADNYQKMLRVANQRHDMVAIAITDPREIEMPRIGIVELEDAETGSRVLLDTSHEPTRRTFWENAVRRQRERAQTLRNCGVDLVELRTDEPYLKPLIRFFRMREARH
jgi:uncharacterized protein (DUF58 family)